MNSMIEAGSIRPRKGFSPECESQEEEVSYKMCFLGKEAVQDMLKLQSQIELNLPEPELFRLHDEDFFQDIFCRERAAVGVLTEEGLIAYSIIRVPGDSVDNLGRDIGLPQTDLCQVAHLQAVAVHPAFRGNGLQQRMAKYHLSAIEEMGFLHVCCTVSVKNPVSLSNILLSGFIIKGLSPKFNGWWRYILYRRNSFPYKKRSEVIRRGD